jgi:hypothetical protein
VTPATIRIPFGVSRTIREPHKRTTVKEMRGAVVVSADATDEQIGEAIRFTVAAEFPGYTLAGYVLPDRGGTK